MNKESMPWVKLKDKVTDKDKGTVDLFFEFLEPKEKKEFYEDLSEGSTIKLPDFGTVGDKVIKNDVKQINKDEITKTDEEFIKRFLRQHVNHPFLEYEKPLHEYKLKPKYDLEKMMREVSTIS